MASTDSRLICAAKAAASSLPAPEILYFVDLYRKDLRLNQQRLLWTRHHARCIISHRDERADGTIYEANGVLLAPNKSADTVVPDFDSISAAKVHVPVSRARCT
jgi:hypothetical protein